MKMFLFTVKSITVTIALFCNLMLLADDSDIELAQKFEAEKEYELAEELLLDNVKESFSEKNCQLLLEFNDRLIKKLSEHIKRRKVTLFVVPGNMKVGETDWLKWADTLHDLLFGPDIDKARKLLEIYLNHKSTKEQRDFIHSLNTPLQNTDEIQQIVELYDILKKNLSNFVIILKREAKRGTIPTSLLKKARQQKETVKKDRTDYISFNVISPCLWEVGRQLFLADSNYLAFFGKDNEILNSAMKLLAKSCHKEWIYQADEDARMQWFDTVKVMKKVVGDKEDWEDYKAAVSLLDSFDKSKKLGEDAWWE